METPADFAMSLIVDNIIHIILTYCDINIVFLSINYIRGGTFVAFFLNVRYNGNNFIFTGEYR